jgi:orotidine-5'-phosphate decarboxylase
MKTAKEYIVFPLDVPTMDDAKHYVELLCEHVGMFKVGLELFIRTGPEILRFIKAAGRTGIFLDLKLHDIPETVRRAMQSIADLEVDYATVHCSESTTMLEAAMAGAAGRVRILGVTVLTSVTSEDIQAAGYKEEFASGLSKLVLQRAAMAKSAGCAGVVCSGLEAQMIKKHFGQDFAAVTPGIRPQWAAGPSDDQRRVTTPAEAVRTGADYLVIGRPIRDAKDPQAAATRIAEEIAAIL